MPRCHSIFIVSQTILGRERQVAGGHRIANSLPGSERRVLEDAELIAEPRERIAARAGRIEDVGSQRTQAADHQPNGRQQRRKNCSERADRCAGRGDERGDAAERNAQSADRRTNHRSSAAPPAKIAAPTFKHRDDEALVLVDPSLVVLRGPHDRIGHLRRAAERVPRRR